MVSGSADMRLTGVMRFLQTEWHRHERDRNAWEIERQEMKARIASLEGAGRRADAHQKSLQKYVKMLEGALLNERKKAKGEAAPEPTKDEKENHVQKTKEHPKRKYYHLEMLDYTNYVLLNSW
jgi:striatin 1/3/4